MDRATKERLIKEYAVDLQELADEYGKAASVIERLPDEIVDAMYATREAGNQIHNDIANELEFRDA